VIHLRRLFAWPARAGLTVLAVAAGTAVAAPAQAAATGVASVVGTTQVRYNDDTSHANRVTVTRSGNTVTIDDRFAIKAGKGCKAVKGDKTKVRCTTGKAPTRVRVLVGYGNDVVVNKSDLPMTADGNLGSDRLYGGSRDDRLYGGSGQDWIWGLGGDDMLDGHTGADVLNGGDGIDVLYGWWGDDRMYGGNGNDSLSGVDGNDRLYGGSGKDTLSGAKGSDRLEGGAGDDNLSGEGAGDGIASDVMLGGAGVDSVDYSERTRAITVDLDGVTGDDGQPGERDTVGADVENLVGGAAGDRLTGNGAKNFINGLSGDDIVRGGAGDDFLYGDTGADQVFGDAGEDWIITSEDGRAYADRVDGGAHAVLGDQCDTDTLDTVVNCER
jgi:serralysin